MTSIRGLDHREGPGQPPIASLHLTPAGLKIVAAHPRTVAFISEIEPGIVTVEAMHFLRPDEARRQAQAISKARNTWPQGRAA